jgi:hypothetical protein
VRSPPASPGGVRAAQHAVLVSRDLKLDMFPRLHGLRSVALGTVNGATTR